MPEKRNSYCTSVFTNKESAPTTERYTQTWINLINQLEKSKETVAAVR